MKKILTFLFGIMLCAFQAQAQNNVTLSVDMTDYITGGGSFSAVNINGTFNAWCGGCNALTQVGATNVYEITINVPDGALDYKFTLDGWTNQETFVGGEDCTVTYTGGPFHNRVIHVDGDMTVPTVCWESCTACGASNTTSNVTFSVDMNDYTGSFTTVYVSGSFNAWNGTANPMTDADMDGVWEATVAINNGTILYKFQVDDWAASETLAEDDCTENDNTNTNRIASFYADKTIPEVCWESCATCGVAPSGPQVAAPTPTHHEVNDNVVSIYSGAYTDITGVNTNPNWGQSTAVTTFSAGGDDALKYANLNYQGTDWGSNPQNVSGNTHVHLDYWTDDATLASFNFYVIKAGGAEVAKNITVTTGSWQSVDIDLADFAGVDLTGVNQFKIDGGGGQTIYFDNFYFYGNPPAVPSGPAPTPTHAEVADNVLSVFSDSYTDIAGTQFNPSWGQSTTYTQEDLDATAATNDALKYATFDYQGTQFSANVDASGRGYLHFDYWTADLGSFTFYLIDTDPETNVEVGYPVTAATSTWTGVDIPLFFFTQAGLDLSSINQIKVDGGTGSETIYFDNIYFYDTWDAPMTGPADPTHDAVADAVISIFSGVYTDVAGTDFDPFWGQGNDATQVSLGGNSALQYVGCDYQGTDWSGTPQDLSSNSGNPAAYDYYLHFDYWAGSGTNAPRIAIISAGQEHSITFPSFTKGSWQSVDIPLANFIDVNTGNSNINLAQIIQFKVDDNNGNPGPYGNLWLDNLYFYKSSPVLAPVEMNFFNAEAEGNTNVLAWQTSSEENNSHFEVERSSNGTDFEVIGTVEGNGTIFEVSDYTFVDEAPLMNTYYRLRQVDFDGEFAYTDIVNVNRRQVGSGDVKVYPNPANDNLTIDFVASANEEVTITVVDMTGRVLITQNTNAVQGENQLNVNLSDLPQGNYFIQLKSTTTSTIQAIVKQ